MYQYSFNHELYAKTGSMEIHRKLNFSHYTKYTNIFKWFIEKFPNLHAYKHYIKLWNSHNEKSYIKSENI